MEADAIKIQHFCLKLLQCIYELQICGDNCDGVTQKQVKKQLKGRFVTDGDLDTQITIGLRQICHKGFITRVKRKFKLVGPLARIILMPHNYKCRQKEITRLQSVFFNSEEPIECPEKFSCSPRKKRKKCKKRRNKPKKTRPCTCYECITAKDFIPSIFGSVSPPHGSVESIVIPRTASGMTRTTGSFNSSSQSHSNGFIDYVSTNPRTMQLDGKSQSNRTFPLDQKSPNTRTVTCHETSNSSFQKYYICSQCGNYQIVCTCDSEACETSSED